MCLLRNTMALSINLRLKEIWGSKKPTRPNGTSRNQTKTLRLLLQITGRTKATKVLSTRRRSWKWTTRSSQLVIIDWPALRVLTLKNGKANWGYLISHSMVLLIISKCKRAHSHRKCRNKVRANFLPKAKVRWTLSIFSQRRNRLAKDNLYSRDLSSLST